MKEATSPYCQAEQGCYRRQQCKEKWAKEKKIWEKSETAVKRALEMSASVFKCPKVHGYLGQSIECILLGN